MLWIEVDAQHALETTEKIMEKLQSDKTNSDTEAKLIRMKSDVKHERDCE